MSEAADILVGLLHHADHAAEALAAAQERMEALDETSYRRLLAEIPTFAELNPPATALISALALAESQRRFLLTPTADAS